MESAGDMIRQARKAQGLSIEELSRRTRVHVDSLRALEDDRYEIFPALTYAAGFLRTCARALEIDEVELIRRFRVEVGEKREEEEQLWGDEPEEPKARRPAWVIPVLAAILVAAIAATALVLWRLRR
jgi:cytoskeleton protein RodZ